MAKNALLMSIRPQYADKIFNGTKTVELRRIKPKFLSEGDLVLVYVSSPVKSLVGAFTVALVIKQPLQSLWEAVKDHAGVSEEEFSNYYQGVQTGVAIFIQNVWLLSEPLHLAQMKKNFKNFHPPQSFRYTSINTTIKYLSGLK
jgi:predicted transcriptional regulator